MFDEKVHTDFLNNIKIIENINNFVINCNYINDEDYIQLIKYAMQVGEIKARLDNYVNNYNSLTRNIFRSKNYKLISCYDHGINYIKDLIDMFQNLGFTQNINEPFDSELSIITRCSSNLSFGDYSIKSIQSIQSFDLTLPLNNLFEYASQYDNNEDTIINNEISDISNHNSSSNLNITEIYDNFVKCLDKYDTIETKNIEN